MGRNRNAIASGEARRSSGESRSPIASRQRPHSDGRQARAFSQRACTREDPHARAWRRVAFPYGKYRQDLGESAYD